MLEGWVHYLLPDRIQHILLFLCQCLIKGHTVGAEKAFCAVPRSPRCRDAKVRVLHRLQIVRRE